MSLREIRTTLGLSLDNVAERFGMTREGWRLIETGASPEKGWHMLAIERLALSIAVERDDPMLAPISVRSDAYDLINTFTGRPTSKFETTVTMHDGKLSVFSNDPALVQNSLEKYGKPIRFSDSVGGVWEGIVYGREERDDGVRFTLGQK